MVENKNTQWQKVKLGDVTETSRSRVEPQDHPDLPYIGMKHVEKESMKLKGTAKGEDYKSSCLHFKPGEVLYGRLRPYLNKVYRPDFEGLCSAEFITLQSEERITPEYLQYVLNSAEFVSFADKRSTGDRPRVKYDQISKYEFPLPPIKIQEQIVNKIEEQTTIIESGVGEIKTAKKRLQKYWSVILKSALEGEFTRSLDTEHEAQTGTIDVKHFPNIPTEWEVTDFNSILGEPLRNGKSAKKSKTEDGIRALTLSAVTERDFSEENTKITVANPDEVSDLWLKNGDILIERSNTEEYVGLASLYRGEDDWAIFPDLMVRARVDESIVMPEYVEYVLRSAYARHYFRKNSKGSSGSMPKINQSHIKELPIPVPPLSEQKELVNVLDQYQSTITDIEESISQNMARAKNLKQSILKHALNGSLDDQTSPDKKKEVSVDGGERNQLRQATLAEIRGDSKNDE